MPVIGKLSIYTCVQQQQGQLDTTHHRIIHAFNITWTRSVTNKMQMAEVIRWEFWHSLLYFGRGKSSIFKPKRKEARFESYTAHIFLRNTTRHFRYSAPWGTAANYSPPHISLSRATDGICSRNKHSPSLMHVWNCMHGLKFLTYLLPSL